MYGLENTHYCSTIVVVIDCIISFLNYFPDDGSSITAETLFFVADIR